MDYNPFTLEMHVNPYPVYKYLLENDPCYYNEELGFYCLSRFDDVWNASHDWKTFSSSCGPLLELDMPVPIMLAMDPPEHQQNRGLISKAFTPRAVEKLIPEIHRIITEHLDALIGCESFDVIEDFAAKFPMDVISAMLGIPEADRPQIRQWSNEAVHRIPGKAEMPPEAEAATMKSFEYFVNCIAERRAKPMDDMMSLLIHSTHPDENDNERSLSDEELIGFFMLLSHAGNETVTRMFGLSINLLAQRPDIREALIEDASLIPGAYEEFLRYDHSGQYMQRVVTKDVHYHGKTIPQGSRVLLLFGAGNRDPREFDKPDEINIHRHIHRKLGFGYGPHLCLGAALARIESAIALEEMHKRFPRYVIHEAGIVPANSSNVRGFNRLPIVIERHD